MIFQKLSANKVRGNGWLRSWYNLFICNVAWDPKHCEADLRHTMLCIFVISLSLSLGWSFLLPYCRSARANCLLQNLGDVYIDCEYTTRSTLRRQFSGVSVKAHAGAPKKGFD